MTLIPPERALSRPDLHLLGFSDHHMDRLTREGGLLRPRRGVYVRGDTDAVAVAAARVGGRGSCVSALVRLGVFVGRTPDAVHVHVAPTASRLRNAGVAAVTHWAPLRRAPHPRALWVDAVDALAQSARCQTPAEFVASVDSALQQRCLHPDDLDEVFAGLPRRFQRLRRHVDGRAESGTESLVRLMLRSLGERPELQVVIDGVGRVDLLVRGWLVVECDSRAHHSSWDAQRRDARRDQRLAALGYAVYRPIAEDLLYEPDSVKAALVGLLARAARR